MKRRARALLLLCMAAVLLGVAVYAEVRREQALAPEPLTRIDPASVRSLVVTCNACTTRRFEKVDGHWWMREPLDRAAADDAVDKLVAIARAPVRFRHARGELDARKLGLDPPQATLQLDGAILRFGTTDAIHGDRYVEVEGRIALVPDRFSARLFAVPGNELAAPPAPAADAPRD